MEKKCKHIVAYFGDNWDGYGIFTEKEILQELKEELERYWHETLDFSNSYDLIKDITSQEDTCYDYLFFDYCPKCGAVIKKDELYDELNQKLYNYAEWLSRNKSKVKAKVQSLRERVDNLERGVE